MNNFFAALEPRLEKEGARWRIGSIGGKTYCIFALPYVQLKEPQAGWAFIDSYYVASNRAYFLRKELAAQLSEMGFAVVDCLLPYKTLAYSLGLGVALRSTLIANDEFGTRMALEVICVDGVYAEQTELKEVEQAIICSRCGLCARRCPQGCFDSGGFEREKCTRHHQDLGFFDDAEIAENAGTNLWGCDVCQRVCPMNSKQGERELTEQERELFSLENLFAAFTAGKKGCEPYRDILGGNYLRPSRLLSLTLNVMANSPNSEQYIHHAEQCLNHRDERVRKAAERLLKKAQLN